MLGKVDLKKEPISKEEYKPAWDELIRRLVGLQQTARREGVGLVVLFEGWNGAGKGSRISDLMYNLDARATSVYVPQEITPKSVASFTGRENGTLGMFPFLQEYWKALGERSSITFVDRGWYTTAAQYYRACDSEDKPVIADITRRFNQSIHDFERQLFDDGYVVVKFFLHVSKEMQQKRLRGLRDDPATRWRVSDAKLATAGDYDELYDLYDRLLEKTSFDFAPWILVNGEDSRQANLDVARTLVQAIEEGLERKLRRDTGDAMLRGALYAEGVDPNGEVTYAERALAQHAIAPKRSSFPIAADYPRLDEFRHDLVMPADEYKSELKRLQKELYRLVNIMYTSRVPLIAVYEGMDAAGKGGNIKRVAQALDARSYTVFPSPAPTAPELARPHLWRYWTRLPKAGHVGLYDRSWYGRVLVERVEGFADSEQWTRAYDEINQFERDLVNWGAVLIKFWVDVSPEEQLRRFKERASDPDKQWKITDEDWRNRDKYEVYKSAIDDMFRLTSTTAAPWIVLESDDKKYARVKALRIIVDRLKDRLGARAK